jgi:hypothetical protein
VAAQQAAAAQAAAAAAQGQQTQQIRQVAQTDGIDRALQLQNERHAQEVNQLRGQTVAMEQQLLAREKAALLAPKLVGIQWASPEAAADAFQKINNAFDVSRGPTGEIVIRERGTMLSVDEGLKNMLAGPTLRHYMAASTQGGTGTGGNAAVSPSPQGGPGIPAGFKAPESPGEQAYAEWFQQVAAQRQAGYAATGLSFGGQFDPFRFGQPAQAPQPQSNGYGPGAFMGQPMGAFALGRN